MTTQPLSREAYKSWTRRTFAPAAKAIGRPDATPYTLRHSFVSLLFAEGRTVLHVARQAGHSAAVCLSTYAHIIEELDGVGPVSAEGAIATAREARVPVRYPSAAAVGAS